MSLKHLKQYYKAVEAQYFEMLQDTADFDIALREGKVTQEQVDQMHQLILPIELQYKTWSYVMFLAGQPAKEDKVKDYFDKNEGIRSSFLPFTLENTTKRNKDILMNYRKFIESTKENKEHD